MAQRREEEWKDESKEGEKGGRLFQTASLFILSSFVRFACKGPANHETFTLTRQIPQTKSNGLGVKLQISARSISMQQIPQGS